MRKPANTEMPTTTHFAIIAARLIPTARTQRMSLHLVSIEMLTTTYFAINAVKLIPTART